MSSPRICIASFVMCEVTICFLGEYAQVEVQELYAWAVEMENYAKKKIRQCELASWLKANPWAYEKVDSDESVEALYANSQHSPE
jgi:hypothetical protein